MEPSVVEVSVMRGSITWGELIVKEGGKAHAATTKTQANCTAKIIATILQPVGLPPHVR